MKVVYLPALPLNSQMYEAQIQVLPGLGVDYPGFAGRPPREGMALVDYAQDVLDQMDRAGIQRAALVGTSMGAQLALYIAAHHPDRVEKLVLTATHALPPVPQEVEMFHGIAAAAEVHGPEALVDNFLQLLLSEKTRREKPQVVERVRQLILAATGQGMAQAFRALATRPDPRPWLGKVRVPTLILWGSEDRAVPPAHRGVLLRIGESRLEMVPDAAHYPSLENPEAYTQALRAFLEG
jgi:pimeloyl-ACP methyl ester carboxylesterase